MPRPTKQPERREPRQRLFLALALPDEARAALAGWAAAALGERESVRLLDPAALHLTLVFLGWRAPEDVAAVATAARAASAGAEPPLLTATAAIGLPPRRPGVVAVDLADERGRAAALQSTLARSLAEAALHEPEERPYRPHVTVARSRRRARIDMEGLAAPPGDPFVAGELVLYRSDLRGSGARYTPLERIALPS